MKRWVLSTFLPLAFLSAASAQITTGIAVSKTCPNVPVEGGTGYTCNFSVQNLDPDNPVINLSVTETPQGGTARSVPCTGGLTSTSLAPRGQAGDTCTGSIQETAPACQNTQSTLSDTIAASGTDTGTNSLVFSSGGGQITIPACTTAPTNTPTATPTNTTPTNTTTATPTTTRTSAPTTTPTVTPTGAASATPTSSPVLTETPKNLRRQPKEIPFRPTISTAGSAAGISFSPLAVLAAVLTGARALSRR